MGRPAPRRAPRPSGHAPGPPMRSTSCCSASAAWAAPSATPSTPSGCPTCLIERDPDIVKALRARGIAACLRGRGQRGILEAAGAEQARLVVVALPDGDRARLAVRHARGLNPARAGPGPRPRSRRRRGGWRAAGASVVVQPEVEAAATLIRHALVRLDLPADRVLAYLDRFRDAMELGHRDPPGRPDGLPRGARRSPLRAWRTLADQSLREARIRERSGSPSSRSAGRRRRGPEPFGRDLVRAGDRLRVFGLPDQIEAFRAEADTPAYVLTSPVTRPPCSRRSRRERAGPRCRASLPPGSPGAARHSPPECSRGRSSTRRTRPRIADVVEEFDPITWRPRPQPGCQPRSAIRTAPIAISSTLPTWKEAW